MSARLDNGQQCSQWTATVRWRISSEQISKYHQIVFLRAERAERSKGLAMEEGRICVGIFTFESSEKLEDHSVQCLRNDDERRFTCCPA